MLETLCAYGAGLLAAAGEQDRAAAALARWAVVVAEQAAAGLQTVEGELAAARWMDAEDATMRQVLAWGMEHDAAITLRMAAALGRWWFLRGRLAGSVPAAARGRRARPSQAATGGAPRSSGSAAWRSSRVIWPHRWAITPRCGTRVAERGPCRALADGLAGRSGALSQMGRYAEAAGEARRTLAVARELGYPVGEVLAMADLSVAALDAGDQDRAVRWPGRPGRSQTASPAR